MQPGSIGVREILGDVMCAMPITGFGEPKDLEFFGEVLWWGTGGGFKFGQKFGFVHARDSDRKLLVEKNQFW